MIKAPLDLYYSIRDVGFLLRFSESWVRRKVLAGDFSPPGEDGKPDLSNILNAGGDIRIPRAGVVFFLDNHPLERRGAGKTARTIKRSLVSPDA